MSTARKQRSYASVDEVFRMYVPGFESESTASPPDPATAGKLLAERVLETLRSELTKRLKRP